MRSYLIVDDNVAFAENLAEILSAEAEAVVADSGAAGLSALRRRRFDALLCDMRLPRMSGAELLQRVRRLDPGLPALVVTAYTEDEELAAARREGVLEVLPKPVPLPRLLELLRRARRDALVVLALDDAARSAELAERLRGQGVTALDAKTLLGSEPPPRPLCALVEGEGALLGRLRARFPALPLVAIEGDDPVSHLMARLERLGGRRA